MTLAVRQHDQRSLSDLEAYVRGHALVKMFTRRVLEGEESHLGAYILVAFIDPVPEFGKLGNRKIPRLWRKLCPSRWRLAFPLPLWCGVSWRMVVRGHLDMAVFQPLPGLELPSIWGSARAAADGARAPYRPHHWVLVGGASCLTETSDVSTTGTKDDSILLTPAGQVFFGPILEYMSKGPKMEKV